MSFIGACCANPFETLGLSGATAEEKKGKLATGGAADESSRETKARVAVQNSSWTQRTKEEVGTTVNQWEQYVHERAYKVSLCQ